MFLYDSPNNVGLEITNLQYDEGLEMSIEQEVVDIVSKPGEVEIFIFSWRKDLYYIINQFSTVFKTIES